MIPDNDIPPLISKIRAPGPRSGHRSLPPPNAPGPHQSLPSYPSSTLQSYYPPPPHIVNYAHISTFAQPPSPHSLATDGDGQRLLPSISQTNVPSLRRTPSVPLSVKIDNPTLPNPPHYDQCILNSPFDGHTTTSIILTALLFVEKKRRVWSHRASVNDLRISARHMPQS